MAFNWEDHPVAPTTPAFNWDDHTPVAQDAAHPTEEISQLESGLRGAGQGISLGFGDEIVGGLSAGADVALGDKKLSDLEQLYTTYRDLERAKNTRAKEANPWTYGGGELAGGIASMAIPGLGIAKGAEVAQAVKLGAAAGLGGSEADLTKGDITGAATDAAIGGAIGGAAQKILPAVGKGISNAVGSLKEGGNDLAESGAKKLYASLNPSNKEVGDFRYALDAGKKAVAPAVDTFEDISLPKMVDKYVKVKGGPDATEKLVQSRIQEIEQLKKPLFQQAVSGLDNLQTQQIDKLASQDLAPKLSKLADDIALEQNNLNVEEKTQLADQIRAMYQNYLKPVTKLPSAAGDAEFASVDTKNLIDLDAMKKAFGADLGGRGFTQAEQIAEGLMSPQNKALLEAKRRAYDVVRDQITDVGNVIGGDIGTQVKRLNLEESNLIKLAATANKAANAEVKATGGGVATGLFGSAGGAIGASVAGPVGGAIGFGAGLATKAGLEDYLGQNIGRAAQVVSGKAKGLIGRVMTGTGNSLEAAAPILNAAGKYVENEGARGVGVAGALSAPSAKQKNVYLQTNEELTPMIQALSSDSTLKGYADHLSQAIQSNDMRSKDQALFVILQNPKARQKLGIDLKEQNK